MDNLMWGDLIRNNEDKIADEIYDAYCDQATFADIDPNNFILIIMDKEGSLRTVETINDNEFDAITSEIEDTEIMVDKIGMWRMDDDVLLLKIFIGLLENQSKKDTHDFQVKHSYSPTCFHDSLSDMDSYPMLKEEARIMAIADLAHDFKSCIDSRILGLAKHHDEMHLDALSNDDQWDLEM